MSALGSGAKAIILTGVLLIILGGILLLAGKVPFLGKLPGDIHIQRKDFSIYFPVATCILLSAVLTVVLNFILRR